MFDFGRTTTNIAAAPASSAAFFTLADWNTYDRFFSSAATCKAGSRSLAVAFRAQCFIRHFVRLPSLQHIILHTLSPLRCGALPVPFAFYDPGAVQAADRQLRRLFRVIPNGLASLGIDQMNPCASRTHHRLIDLVANLG